MARFLIANSEVKPGWALWNMGNHFAIVHKSGLQHRGGPGYIRALWNARFAGKTKRVKSLS